MVLPCTRLHPLQCHVFLIVEILYLRIKNLILCTLHNHLWGKSVCITNKNNLVSLLFWMCFQLSWIDSTLLEKNEQQFLNLDFVDVVCFVLLFPCHGLSPWIFLTRSYWCKCWVRFVRFGLSPSFYHSLYFHNISRMAAKGY